MKKIFQFLFILILLSCRNNEDYSESKSKEVDYDLVCECLKTIELNDYEVAMKESSKCIVEYSGNDTDLFYKILNKTMLLCPDFVMRLTDYEFKQLGYDTLKFEPITHEECNSIQKGTWKNLNPSDKGYSVTIGDTVFQYDDKGLNSVWLKFESNGCEQFFKVIRKVHDIDLPPNLGDTIKYSLIGKRDSLIKNIFEYKEMKIIGIVYKIKQLK